MFKSNNGDIYIVLYGGFGDNILMIDNFLDNDKVYFIANNELFNRLYQDRITHENIMECGQRSDNVLKFPFKRVLNKLPEGVVFDKLYYVKDYIKELSHRDYLRKVLLSPLTRCKQATVKLFSDSDYLLIGMRCHYGKLNTFMKNKRTHSYIYSKFINSINSVISDVNRVVLMFDDYNYIYPFIVICGDVLDGKQIVPLSYLTVDDIPDMLYIGYHSRYFIHNFSRLYNVIEAIKR